MDPTKALIAHKQKCLKSHTYMIGDICIYRALKVLSGKMDPAEIRLILKVFIKGRGADILANFAHPLACENPLKLWRFLVH
jgi:hypothetical protein